MANTTQQGAVPQCYMVRAMHSQPNDFELFFGHSVVAVGWSDIDFTEYIGREDELIARVKEEYYAKPDLWPPSVGRQLNQVSRFMALMPGDRVLVPYYDGVCLATVIGVRSFSPESIELDLSNQITVDYQFDHAKQRRVIPRNSLSEALQRRLRVRGSTVSDLNEFAGEIEDMFNSADYSWSSQQAQQEEQVKQMFRTELLQRIQAGFTNLRTGGLGLEHLVKDLFIAEGYKATVLDKRHFKEGDADVEAKRTDQFQTTRILAQVKHHSGTTNKDGLEQLKAIQQSGEEVDTLFVLITTASLPQEVQQEAELRGVQTMDGEEFADWVVAHLHHLKPEIVSKLGISSVPRFVVEK